MAKHIVIEKFEDRDGKVYKAGEVYPRPANKKVSKKRLDELLTDANREGRPFIELEVEEKEEKEESEDEGE